MELMDKVWIWASLGSLFLMAEIFLGTQFFLFFIATAFYLSAIVFYFYPQISFEGSLFVVAFFSCLSPLIWFIYFRPYFRAKMGQGGDVNHALIGLKGHVITLDKNMDSGISKVKIKHSLWDIRSEDGTNYKAGDKVKVIAIEGVTLIVDKEQ